MRKSLLVSVALCAGLGSVALAWRGRPGRWPPHRCSRPATVRSRASTPWSKRYARAWSQPRWPANVALEVKAGDQVRAGQTLARIDARAAEQTASASDAQVRSAQALLDVASKDFERQKQLHDKQYISQAALERAESQFKASQAQAAALLAQANAARTIGLHVVRAPFAGVVAEVPVALGDMALPGKPLLTLYEPGALRVTAALPQSRSRRRRGKGGVPEPAGYAALVRTRHRCSCCRRWTRPHTPCSCASHCQTQQGLAPGLFARVWLPAAAAGAPSRLYVPASAVLRRAELTGVYVVDAQGAPVLRQVRLGRARATASRCCPACRPASAWRWTRRPQRGRTEHDHGPQRSVCRVASRPTSSRRRSRRCWRWWRCCWASSRCW